MFPPMTLTVGSRLQAVRNAASTTSVRTTDWPPARMPKAERSTWPGVRALSLKLQPVRSTGAALVLVNSMYSPSVPEYIHSVM